MVEKIGHVRNPLTVIAIFAGIAEISGTVVLPLLEASIQSTYVWFLMLFPFFLVGTFFLVLYRKHGVLYAPSDYKEESNFFRKATDREVQLSRLEKAIQAEEPSDTVSVESESEPSVQDTNSNDSKPNVELPDSVSAEAQSTPVDPLPPSTPTHPAKDQSEAINDAKTAMIQPSKASEIIAAEGRRLSEIGIGELWKTPFMTHLRHIETLAVSQLSKTLGIAFERNITLDLPGLEKTVVTALGRSAHEIHIVEVRYAKDGRFDVPGLKSLLFDLDYARRKLLEDDKPIKYLQLHLFLVADNLNLINSQTAQNIFRFVNELGLKPVVHFTTVDQLERAILIP